MQPLILQQKIMQHMRETSGLDEHRPYLGMSSIGQCARRLYFQFVTGRNNITDRDHLACYNGYLLEGDVLKRLASVGVARVDGTRELVAPFDSRFRGHTDGETIDGDLLEIKTVNNKKFEAIVADNRARTEHFYQVQTYLRYGPWRDALLVYINRDSFQHFVLQISQNDGVGFKMETKAKRILSAIDAMRPPDCECGYCKD